VLPGRTGALANITEPPQAAAPRLRCWAIDRLLGEATRAGSRSPQCREGACRFLPRERPQQVEAEWSGVLRTVRAGMLAVPSRCQQRLPHLTAHDTAQIDREVWDVLAEIAE